jgi:hypothetical protein
MIGASSPERRGRELRRRRRTAIRMNRGTESERKRPGPRLGTLPQRDLEAAFVIAEMHGTRGEAASEAERPRILASGRQDVKAD